MDDTVTVASRAPMAVRISEPAPAMPLPTENPNGTMMTPVAREGADIVRPTFVLNGANHPGAVNGVGITHGVPAAIFRAWHEMHEKIGSELHSMFEVVDDDFKADAASENGFEPGLKRLAESGENTDAAEEGSTVTEPGPVSSEEMKATSPIPADMQDIPPDQIPTDVTHPKD